MTPAVATTALDAFEADLTAGGIVTRVLERWAGGPVRAERVAATCDAPAAIRTLLDVAPDVALGFRRVRLMHGDVLLSEADNWYVPDRLTADMRKTLADGRTPFGAAIEALGPRRRTLDSRRLGDDPVLHLRATVLDRTGRPLATVDELYRAAIFTAL